MFVLRSKKRRVDGCGQNDELPSAIFIPRPADFPLIALPETPAAHYIVRAVLRGTSGVFSPGPYDP